MTRILAFETSTSSGTVALLSEQGSTFSVTQRTIEGTTGHASAILPLAYSILTEHNLTQKEVTAVAFGQGPGAFTGVRVACGVAQGIALALDIPLIQVGALPAVAAQASPRHPGALLFVALEYVALGEAKPAQSAAERVLAIAVDLDQMIAGEMGGRAEMERSLGAIFDETVDPTDIASLEFAMIVDRIRVIA